MPSIAGSSAQAATTTPETKIASLVWITASNVPKQESATFAKQTPSRRLAMVTNQMSVTSASPTVWNAVPQLISARPAQPIHLRPQAPPTLLTPAQVVPFQAAKPVHRPCYVLNATQDTPLKLIRKAATSVPQAALHAL